MDENKRRRAEAIKILIKHGWSPPTPTDVITDRILNDIEEITSFRPNRTNELTENELLVLTLAARGMTYAEIANIREVTLNTVKSQLDTIRNKLGARNLPHAIAIAYNQDLIIKPK